MSYIEFNLDITYTKELTTRLVFDIATARNSGFALLKFIFPKDASDKFKKALSTRLRDMKKKGRIELFASSREFSSPTTEIQYLLNKYPSLANESDSQSAIYVKL